MQLFDLEAIRRFLVEVARHYAESSPDVSDWAGEIYERCSDDWRTITLDEPRTAEWLRVSLGDPGRANRLPEACAPGPGGAVNHAQSSRTTRTASERGGAACARNACPR